MQREESRPSSPVGATIARFFGVDSSAALGQQIESIFMNLLDAPDTRAMRVEECLNSLMDTLFSHAEEISTNESLQQLLLRRVESTFDNSVEKGCRSVAVVFDIQWRDQHEKRSQCLALLINRALQTRNRDHCLRILDSVAEVLEENIRSTTDLIAEHLSVLTMRMRCTGDPCFTAASCELLAKIIEISATLIKRNPTQLEQLAAECPALALLRQAMETTDVWHRTAVIRLLVVMVQENCYELSAELADRVAEAVRHYISSVTEETQLVGALSILSEMGCTPAFSQAAWDLVSVADFFTEHNWSVCSKETRALAAYTTAKVGYTLCANHPECYHRLSQQLLLYASADVQEVVEHALAGLLEILQSNTGLTSVAEWVKVLRACIHRLVVHLPIIFEVLEHLRARYEDANLTPIYDMVDEYMSMDDELVNYGKLNSLLRFMGDRADLQRPDFLRLPVDLSLQQADAVLIRSLPLLTTLRRTSQLSDAILLLFHDTPAVRRAAIATVVALCELIIEDDGEGEDVSTQRLDSRVSFAVQRILDVAVADRNPQLRHEALRLLTKPFYPYLSLPDNLDDLFMTRNDTDTATRDESLVLLCQLLPYHPEIVRPQLLRTQEYMLRDVEAQDSSVSLAIYKAELIVMCANHSTLLLEPESVERAALQRLMQRPFVSKRLSIVLLGLIKSVLEHSSPPSSRWDSNLFVQPVVALVNSDSSKRCRAALDTLSAIVTTLSLNDTPAFIDIYRSVVRIIRSEREEHESVTVAAIKVVSTIGAVNPVKMRKVLHLLDVNDIETEEEVVTLALTHSKPRLRLYPNMSDRYPSVVLYYLVKALQMSADTRQQVETLSVVRTMLQCVPRKRTAALLTQLLPQLQAWLADPEKVHLYDGSLLLMADLAVLLRQFKETVPSSVGYEILRSVQQFCSLPQAARKPLSTWVVQLLDELAKGLPAQEMRDHRWAVEFIHQRLSQNKNDLDLVQRVVKSLDSFLEVMHEKDIQWILPHVLQCIEPAQTTSPELQPKMKDINNACFNFLNYVMVKQLSLIKDCCAQIVHTIMWYIELSENQEEMDMGLNTIACLIDVIKLPAKRFIMPVERVAIQNGYPQNYFINLVQSASGGRKAHASLSSQSDFNPDLPLQITFHLPRLTRREFETSLQRSLRINDKDFNVLDVTHLNGQTVISFRVSPGDRNRSIFNLFIRHAQDQKSYLCRTLGILKLEQALDMPWAVDSSIVQSISVIPSAKTKKREQSWISWVHNTSVTLLRNSPYAPLRCVAAEAARNGELARDLFPFAAVAIIGSVPDTERQQLMEAFNRAVQLSPNDTKQCLYILAEFMEAERGEQKPKPVRRPKQSTFVVTRETPDQKFGINYDQDPMRGVVVTKLAPNGLGATAGVPVGGRLLAINNCAVRSVSDIRAMIDKLTTIELTISYTVEELQPPERKALMDIDVLADVAFTSQMHTKAIYFNEVLYERIHSGAANTSIDGLLMDNKGSQADTLHVGQRVLVVARRLKHFYEHLNLEMAAYGLEKLFHKLHSGGVRSNSGDAGDYERGEPNQQKHLKAALLKLQTRMVGPEGGLHIPEFLEALRCEETLGNDGKVCEMIAKYWDTLSDTARQKIAPHRARAAFYMCDWRTFDALTSDASLAEELDTVEHGAVLFRAKRFKALLAFTQSRREDMVESFSESFNESYSRAYDALVELQHLTHLEELVSFALGNPERRVMLQHLWQRRMANLSTKPVSWKTMISLNSLVLSPRDDIASQIMAIHSLTRSQWHLTVEHMLGNLLDTSPTLESLSKEDPELIHAYMKHLYATSTTRRVEVYELLHSILQSKKVMPSDHRAEMWGTCWLLFGEWTMTLFHDMDCGDDAAAILLHATELSPLNSAAFHSLGILHYDLSRDPSTPQEVLTDHHISAVMALVRSVQLRSDHSNSSVMQDILLILSIWFSHSSVVNLNKTIKEGVQLLPDHVWLHVIPQLIARIGITTKLARTILADLLVRVGTTYPHALIYPLTVAEKSPDAIRKYMAECVLAGIRSTNDQMVEEASRISNEMVRIAILWAEKWHAAIQLAASKPDNGPEIMATLAPLFAELANAETPNERNFDTAFGPALRRAQAALQEKSLDRFWTLVKQVYMQLNMLLSDRRLSMSDVSPTLDKISESIVTVPGTFEHGRPLVTIQQFHPRVYVMPSKQKPRRLGLDASDGKKYRFLLKGHEDMRQDERVMQFIGLIDTIFMSDNEATSVGLSLPQYAVIPLTDNVGIIGWVENTETIYKMLETHRKDYGVSIYEEVNLIVKRGGLQQIDEFHRLPKVRRKELLRYAMSSTPDDELRQIMWARNDTCEQWLGYRSTYGLTLAAMSIVGYVLGLGDRHLNNLMLADNGTVVHIDFGDCFEVAMHRAQYAEKVPFRLTRILIPALGISGVDGVFRSTCILVMRNLRRHSETLLSILEAFIYDPLINWRLTVTETERPGSNLNTPISDVTEPVKERPMQLSRSFAKPSHPVSCAQTLEDEEETRNQQGDLALARVHAKLTGQDFGLTNSSFSRSSRRAEEDPQLPSSTSWSSNTGVIFGESPKDSVGAPNMTYLSLRALTGGAECLDVPQQVDRLIQEATSQDNLADAYLTGWAPFW